MIPAVKWSIQLETAFSKIWETTFDVVCNYKICRRFMSLCRTKLWNLCEVKYEHIVSLLSVLIFVFTLNNFKEFVEDIECGRQRIIFATTVIFITKSTSLDIFFLRFQYSFFSMFSYTRATVWLKKNGCIEYGEEDS